MPRPSRLLGLVLGLALAAPAVASAEVRTGGRAAELTRVVDARGKKLSLRALKDKVVVLTFGASWCAPCKKELPAYEKLAAAYAKKGARVVFLAINIDTDRKKGEAFVKAAGLRHVRVGFDPGHGSVDSYDPPKMPTTFVVRGGIVRHMHEGYSAGDEKKLAGVIDGELKKL